MIMKNETSVPIRGDKRFSLSVHLLFCILAAVVIYTTVNTYIKGIVTGDDEEIATAAVFFILGGIYGGRFLSQLWVSQNKVIPVWLLVLLPLVITACIFVSVFFCRKPAVTPHPDVHFISCLSIIYIQCECRYVRKTGKGKNKTAVVRSAVVCR